MCLGDKLSDRSLQRYKAKGKKRGYIRVWKCVDDRKSRYYPQWRLTDKPYKKGLNLARLDAEDEHQLIHAFRNKISAIRWNEDESSYSEVVLCYVKPKWVAAIGYDEDERCSGLTTKAIVMPEYPKRKVTVVEFRAAIKGKKVKTYSWE